MYGVRWVLRLYIYQGDHLSYINVYSWGSTHKTNIILYVNCNLKIKKLKMRIVETFFTELKTI